MRSLRAISVKQAAVPSRCTMGSKSGLHGDIRPISRGLCDFGQGFYMGTEKSQPLILICNFPQARLYEVEFDLTGLQLIDIEVGIDWALLIAFHRGKMEDIKGDCAL